MPPSGLYGHTVIFLSSLIVLLLCTFTSGIIPYQEGLLHKSLDNYFQENEINPDLTEQDFARNTNQQTRNSLQLSAIDSSPLVEVIYDNGPKPDESTNRAADKESYFEAGSQSQEKVTSKMPLSMKQFFLNTHNQMRRDVALGLIDGQPPAADMNKLEWDDELASRAQLWADRCMASHDRNSDRKTQNFPFVGQNWGGMRNVTETMWLWFREHEFYNYQSKKCLRKPCAHYTQLVWSWTTHVGCGVADCFGVEGFPYGRTVVCNYGPGGNMQLTKPYKKGEACSGCLLFRPNCEIGLCVK